MNARRRKSLKEALTLMENLKVCTDIEKAVNALNYIHRIIDSEADNEEFCLDEMPENLYWSARCEAMRDNVEDLEDAADTISAVLEEVESMKTFDFKSIHKDINHAANKVESAIYR